MVAISKVLFFAVTATALVLPRSVSQVSSDISNIDSQTKKLTSAINSYNGGGVANALPVQSDEQDLDKAIKSATTDAQNTPKANSADSKKILGQIKTLIPDIESALTALKNKKSKFEADGLGKTVHDDLTTLKTDTDSFGSALLKIASSDAQSEGKSDITKIDGDFNSAISDFA